MATIKAVLFDFGGTLFDYEGVETTRPTLAAKLGGLLGTDAVDDVDEAWMAGFGKAFAEVTPHPYYLHRDLLITAAHHAAASLDLEISDENATAFSHFFDITMVGTLAPRVGMRETLAELRSRGLHVGGASNSDIDQFTMLVDALDVRDAFDSLMCSEDAQSCKPDQKFFEMALANAGCRAEEAVYVGDTPMHDIAGGNRAGMRTVLIAETTNVPMDRGKPGEEDALIRELPELLDYLDSL